MSVDRQAITANSLQNGEVVFRAGGLWTPQLADADLYDDPVRADDALTVAKAEVTHVVDAYLIEVALAVPEGGASIFPVPVPKSYRERIRALGPPVHPDLGKQAEGGAAIEAIAQATGGARSTGRLSLIRRK